MLILDRFDDRFAYISSDNGLLCADRRLIDQSAKEGDVLRPLNDLYIPDEEATCERRAQIRSLLHDRLKLRT